MSDAAYLPRTDSSPSHPRAAHAVLLTAAQLSRGLFRLLWVLIVARRLGPAGFGVYTLLFAITEIIAVISGVGFGDYLTREASKSESWGWALGIRLTWLRLAYLVPLTVIELAGIWLFGYSHVVLLGAAWMAATFVPRALVESVEGVLRGIESYGRYLLLELALGLVLLGGGFVLVLDRGGLAVAIAVEIASVLCAGVVALAFVLGRATKEHVASPGWAALIRGSAVFNIYPLVMSLFDRVDVLLLARLAGDYATGVYSAAYRPLGTAQLLPYGVLYSLLPALSRDAGKNEQRRLERAMGLLLSTAFVAVLVTMIFAGPAVRLLLGAAYAESAVALKILIWAVILRYVNYSLNIRLLAAGSERVFVVTSLVCLAVNIVANVVFIPLFSWRAAAVITIVTEVVLLAQNVYWLRRTTGGVPQPVRWVRTSLVFAALLLVAVAGARIVPPLFLGSACVLAFLGYLYRTGMMAEFAATWGTGRLAAWQGPGS